MSQREQRNLYVCKHCGRRVWRNSNKAWIKSICGKIRRDVHLQLSKAVVK